MSLGDDFLPTDKDNSSEEKNTQTLDLYDVNKGMMKRDGGPYLDQVQRESAEIIRAQREDREPDLKNPPADAGTYLVPKHYLRETDASKSHVSAAAEQENEPEARVKVDTHSAFDDDADPRQVDWDNDHQKVRAMDQVTSYETGADKLGTPDKEPNDEPVSDNAPDQPDSSANNDSVITGVANNSWTAPGSPNAPAVDTKDNND